MYINSIKDIQKVKLQPAGYIINGNVFVPKDPANRHYQLIQEWLAEGNNPEPEYNFDEKKQQKIEELKLKFQSELNKAIYSKTINNEINFGYEHIINIENLINYATINKLEKINLRLYNNSFIEVDLSTLKEILNEMIEHKIKIYNKKWEYEKQIFNSSSIEDLEKIDISF